MNPSFMARYLSYLKRDDIVEDDRHNVYTLPARLEAILGKPRPLDPVGEPEHTRLAMDANTDGEIEERRHDLEEQEKQVAQHTKRWVLVPALLVVFILESVSCIAIFAANGFEMPERAIYGLGLATGTFVLTYFTVQHASRVQEEVTP